MAIITYEHINRLIALESEVNYDKPPIVGRPPFIIVENESPIIISAPHGARTFRNNKDQVWHEEDEYTAGMACLLGELCKVSAIATNSRIDDYDPNYACDLNLPYKEALGRLLHQHHIRFLIDLHGASLHSPTLDPKQTIDLGLRQSANQDEPSMNLDHVQKLENFLLDTGYSCDVSCFVLGRNKFPGAGKGTIITFATNQDSFTNEKKVQAIQIEMKPQVRIASRFPTATLYKSCGPYQAKVENVVHMLQSLNDFIDYLKET